MESWAQFWKLLCDSLVSSYDNNCKEKVEAVFGIISRSCKLKKNWYIPTTGEVEIPHESCTLQEQQHTALCTWLLGHLFCLYEREVMSDVHSSCTKAQIEVLAVCSENRYMNRVFFHEYLCCLKDLIEIQSSKSILNDGPQLLRRFTPLPVESLKEMNLMPKYILVHSESLLKSLVKYVVEILESVVQYVVHVHGDLIEDMWMTLCHLLSVATLSVKRRIISIFSQIVSVVGCDEQLVMQNLCNALRHMVQALPYQCSEGKSPAHVQELRFAIGNLLNIIITCGPHGDEKRDRDLLTVLHSLLLAWEFENIQGSALQTACCNVVSLLRKIRHGSVDANSYIFLLRTESTQGPSIQIFENVMLLELEDYVKSLQAFNSNRKVCKVPTKSSLSLSNEQVHISALSLPTWVLLHKKLWDDMASIHNLVTKNLSERTFEQLRNLVGRVHIIVCSAVGLDALALPCKEQTFISINFFGEKVTEFFTLLKSTLISLGSLREQLKGQERILELLFNTIANLMLLPEMNSCSVGDTKFAVSLLSLLWVEKNEVMDLEVERSIVGLKDMLLCIQETGDGETLKSKSLKVLAKVPHGLYPRWRLSLFKIATNPSEKNKSQEDVSLAIKAMETIPCLLMDQQPSDVMGQILLPIITSECDYLLISLSKIFSTIVCVLAGNYVPVSVKSSSGIPMRSLICRTCNKKFSGCQHRVVDALHSLKTELLDFMELLSSPITAVRLNMVSSLGSLVLHLPTMYQPDVLCKWMKYAEDPDHQVRTVFSCMVKFLIFQRGWMEDKEIESENLKEEHIPLTQVDRAELTHSRPRLERVLAMLFEYMNANLSGKNQDSALQNTLLETIVDIGCVPLDCVLLPVIKIVLLCVSHPAFAHPAVAQVYLKQIADSHNTSPAKLYLRFQSDICKVLLTLAGMNFHMRPSWHKYMDKVVYALGFESTSIWLRESFTRVAPILFVYVVKCNDKRFLHEIATLLQTSKQSLVRDYFEYIYPYVFLNEPNETVDKCVRLMEDLYGSPSKDLLIKSFKNIHAELLLHYPSKRQRVEEGICKLINALENRHGNKSRKLQVSSSSSEIAEHLDKRFLGVLVHFDILLESPDSEEDLKIKVLQSLPEIIRLLGPKYITPVRFKVLSTLRTALRLTHCDFPHLSCSAWEAFIKSVELPDLGPLLGTIVVSLMPLLDQYEVEISAMFKWLVVKHEQNFSENIPDLFFLPNKPAIKDVYDIVQKHLNEVEKAFDENRSFADYLQQPLRFVAHDNIDIRKHGLQHLLTLLTAKQEKFLTELLSKEIVHPDVAKLLNLLVRGCQDPDQDVRLLCVQNLGMLGALDPSHLPQERPEKDTPLIVNVKDDKFGVQALSVLARGYHTARNTRNLDSFACAIQDLMKHFKISSSRKELWDSFPESVQQIMAPLESSSYCPVWQQNTVWPHPLFGTRYASSLTNWAHTWACRLVNFIEKQFAKEVFTLCIPSLKTDVNCVMHFLPLILLYAVIYGNEEQHKMISEEISIIIQQCKHREEGEESHLCIVDEKLHIRNDRYVTLPNSDKADNATHALCAKTVFTLLDFMEKWVNSSRKHEGDNPQNKDNVKFPPGSIEKVDSFIGLFSKLDLAYGNYGVKEYARALMYLEDLLMEKQELIKDHLGFMGRIFAQMNEPEGIKGVLAIQCSQPTLIESVVYHEVTGQYQEALACYELLAKLNNSDALSLRIQLGMVRCCLKLDQPHIALRIAEGVTSYCPEYRSGFLEAQAECFWRTNSFDDLDKVLSDPKLENSTAWGVCIGRCLMDMCHNNYEKLSEHLLLTRSSLSKALSTASLEHGSYFQGYLHVVKLHMLQEVEAASVVIARLQSLEESESSCIEAVQYLVKLWRNRFELVEAGPGIQEQLLRLHRSLLELVISSVKKENKILIQFLRKEIGHSWLKSAEVARVAFCYQQAYVYLLHAEKYKPKRHFIELAQLHRAKNVLDSALSTLRRGLEEHFPSGQQNLNLDVEDLKICAEAKLLIALYNDQNVNVDCDINVANYKEAIKVYSSDEKSHAYLAQYYDRMAMGNPEDRSVDSANYQLWAVQTYLKSLKYGCSEIYHSMSRMLTIWLDFGKTYQEDVMVTSKTDHNSYKYVKSIQCLPDRKTCLLQMNEHIDGYLNVLQPYMFMVGFSQLVSCICHPMKDVYMVIKKIIVKLILSYPQQSMWMILASSRSSYPLRQSRCSAVLDDPLIKDSDVLLRLTNDFLKLGGLLVDLCQKPLPPDITKTTVSNLVKNLPKVLAQPSFSKIIVPLLSSRTLTLPKLDHTSLDTHFPFSLKTPFIEGICDEVSVLHSLQKPRKITLRGSDGQLYEIMCKDKDDLRLDARVMEFNSIVNTYLQKDTSSRTRNLNIRTYSVVPLSEVNGLIEWVPNLMGYRLIILTLMRELGIAVQNRDLVKFKLAKEAPLYEKRKRFLETLLPLYPPVFRFWFRNNFTDSRSWFEARKSYVHTTAVMSIVGYILGLGDRHGENILLDTTCGDVVHVDFNCLFNQGEAFQWPERVPFRLTHNMVNAMGPTGVEGPFRSVCEITLNLLRNLRNTLSSVLQPFVYDSHKSRKSTASDDATKKAQDNVKNIDLRLNGMLKTAQKTCTLQLSVEGQTAFLIQEATNIDNLCQMYIGWAAYM